jgi:aminoglycoside 3-N-acetyltransferase
MNENNLMEEPLFQDNNEIITYKDFRKALDHIGIKRGDVLFVHSDISKFGKLCSFDRKYLITVLIQTLKDAVGPEGTLIMPTFSYSFCKNELYDKQTVKSTVGVMTEYFRKMPDILRTSHPIFSVAVYGAQKDQYADIGKDAFSKDSIFGKIHRNNGKIVLFGAPFAESLTFLHYIEQTHGVPYRYIKRFEGEIRDGNVTTHDYCTYYVRDLERNSIPDDEKIRRHLQQKGLYHEVRVGNGIIGQIGCKDLFEEGMRMLDQDINFFVKGSA